MYTHWRQLNPQSSTLDTPLAPPQYAYAHTHTPPTDMLPDVQGCTNAVDLALPAGQKDAVPWTEFCMQI